MSEKPKQKTAIVIGTPNHLTTPSLPNIHTQQHLN
jgi:hypothetical protein